MALKKIKRNCIGNLTVYANQARTDEYKGKDKVRRQKENKIDNMQRHQQFILQVTTEIKVMGAGYS